MLIDPALPIKALIAFEATARIGSFSGAAEALSLTQSAVSQQVRKLEEFLGQALFLRRGSVTRLTAAGELLYASVRTSFEHLGAGVNRIAPYKNRDSVLLVCPPDLAHGWLMPRLGQLRTEQPSVEVWVITTRELREIDRVDADLIISMRPIHTADVECITLLDDASIAICAPAMHVQLGKAAFPQVLERVPLVFMESDPDWGGLLLRHTGKRPLRLTRAATMDSAVVLIDAVANGIGMGYVSRAAALGALDSGRVVPVAAVPSTARPRLWLMRSRLTPRTPVADHTFAWLKRAAAAGITRRQ